MMKRYRQDGWSAPEEEDFTMPVLLGPKIFKCPGCGANWRVAPKKSANGRYWDYEGVCGNINCGGTWVNRYHAWRKPTEAERLVVEGPSKEQLRLLPDESDE
jgi:hypothetical protein